MLELLIMPRVGVLFVPKDILSEHKSGTVLGNTTREKDEMWVVITELVTQDGTHKNKVGSLLQPSEGLQEHYYVQVILEREDDGSLLCLNRNLTADHRTKIIVYDKDSLQKSDLLFLLHNPEEKSHMNFLLKCNTLKDINHWRRVCSDEPESNIHPSLRFLRISSCFRQCQLRITTVHSIIRGIRTTKGVIIWNKAVILLLDLLLGLACYHYLTAMWSVDDGVKWFLHIADMVVTWLEGLITWLMGAPAGLKLNAPLSHNMGKFFLYHIYLWRNYINLVTPLLKTFMLFSLSFSQFSLSFLLSAVTDLFFLATIHIYCFYAYAARLYQLFVLWIGSLWRLFRGRKWNPLRNRVDSYSYDANHLITGTVGFSILLFLLPTVALYYVVFATLWLAVLSIRGSLWFCQQILNYNPLALFFIWIVCPCKLKGNFRIDVYGENSEGCTLLRLRTSGTSFTKAFGLVSGKSPSISAREVTATMQNLMNGTLVYPL